MPELPWCDCKVAFGAENEDAIWRWSDSPDSQDDLPASWSLCETDCSGARLVVVFRVEGPVLPEDGEKVIRLLRRIRALAPLQRRAA